MGFLWFTIWIKSFRKREVNDMGGLVLLGIGFVAGGIVGIIMACACNKRDDEDDEGEW